MVSAGLDPMIQRIFQILWVGILKILSGSVDTKPKLLKAMRDWDWRPLLKALKLHESMPLFGGNAASVNAATALKFLLGEDPQPEEGLSAADKAAIQFAQDAVVEAGGVEVLVNVSIMPTLRVFFNLCCVITSHDPSYCANFRSAFSKAQQLQKLLL